MCGGITLRWAPLNAAVGVQPRGHSNPVLGVAGAPGRSTSPFFTWRIHACVITQGAGYSQPSLGTVGEIAPTTTLRLSARVRVPPSSLIEEATLVPYFLPPRQTKEATCAAETRSDGGGTLLVSRTPRVPARRGVDRLPGPYSRTSWWSQVTHPKDPRR